MGRKARKAEPHSPPTTPPPGGLEELGRLDKLLEHRLRLAICVLLARYDRVTFSRFKELTGETDGNLGANLRKLEDEGYVDVDKRIVDRKPVSTYSLTKRGRAALRAHVDAMSALLGRTTSDRETSE